MRIPLFIILLLISTALVAGEAVPVTVTLNGRILRVNGQTDVPVGLFGVHAVKLTEALVDDLGIGSSREILFAPEGGTRFIDGKTGRPGAGKEKLTAFIDCHGDRFCAPLVLTVKDWEAACRRLGTSYGERWKRLSADPAMRARTGIAQWWNEAYLNWAERSAGSLEEGSTINQRFYDVAQAVEGGPVTIKGWTTPLAHYRWRGLWPVRYEDGKDRKGRPVRLRLVGWNIAMPEDAQVGTVFSAPETRYWRKPGAPVEWTVEQSWYPVDPTMVSYWSGEQNLDFYRWTYRPWAEAVRAADPTVTLLAGWDFNYDAGDWTVWTQLYRPLVKEFPTLIDGLTEHHYGIPPEQVRAWYEVGTADAWAISGRFLRHWNTECQGRLDPAVHGAATNAVGGDATARLWEARYNIADIVGMVAQAPDKAASRTVHNFVGGGFDQGGAAWALRLLKPLRGRLLAVESGDAGLWTAASVPAGGGVVIACWNQRDHAATVTIDAAALGSRRGTWRRVVADPASGALSIAETAAEAADGRFAIDLDRRDGAVLVADGAPGVAASECIREQFFAREGALLPAGADVTATIAIPGHALTAARRAWLRVVVLGGGGQGGIVFNDQPLAFARDLPVTDVPLPLERLEPGDNRVGVPAAIGRFGAVSVVIERDAK